MQRMPGRPGDDLLGLVHDFATKLRSGAITPREGRRFLRREDPWGSLSVELPVWKTIKIGVHKNSAQYRRALGKEKVVIGNTAMQMLKPAKYGPKDFPDFECSRVEEEVDLVELLITTHTNRVSLFPEQPACGDGARFKAICERGLDMGLRLCRPEIGPALALNYQVEAQYSQMRWIAMTPLLDHNYEPHIFRLFETGPRDNVKVLLTDHAGYAEVSFSPGCFFVFEKPRT